MALQDWGERYEANQISATAEFFTLLVKVSPCQTHPRLGKCPCGMYVAQRTQKNPYYKPGIAVACQYGEHSL